MTFNEAYKKSKSISIKGNIVVPKGYHGETNIIIPEGIVRYCARKYKLVGKDISVIDPMCGVGTIPRVINELGGNCTGCEIESERYEIASENTKGKILKGDYRIAPIKIGSYDCIFTSMPFVWFKDLESISNLDTNFIKRFREILKPDGFILIDSLPEVERSGEVWPVAEMQTKYFKKNGFTLSKVVTFENEEHIDSTSSSVIMKFV